MLTLDSLFDKFQTKAEERFESVDEYFKMNTIETTHSSKCVCGCVDTTGFFDILRKEYEVVKEFLEYCFEKNYIKKDDETFQLKCAKKY
jgi:ribosome biogenesis protein Nip4